MNQPESGAVVKALEWYHAADLQSVEWGITENLEKQPTFHALRALPLAREQEALLREYMESHRVEAMMGDLMEGVKVLQECTCDLCERARKVLP